MQCHESWVEPCGSPLACVHVDSESDCNASEVESCDSFASSSQNSNSLDYPNELEYEFNKSGVVGATLSDASSFNGVYINTQSDHSICKSVDSTCKNFPHSICSSPEFVNSCETCMPAERPMCHENSQEVVLTTPCMQPDFKHLNNFNCVSLDTRAELQSSTSSFSTVRHTDFDSKSVAPDVKNCNQNLFEMSEDDVCKINGSRKPLTKGELSKRKYTCPSQSSMHSSGRVEKHLTKS